MSIQMLKEELFPSSTQTRSHQAQIPQSSKNYQSFPRFTTYSIPPLPTIPATNSKSELR